MKRLLFIISLIPFLCFSGEAEKVAAAKLMDAMHLEDTVRRVINSSLQLLVQTNPELASREKEMKKVFTKYLSITAMRNHMINTYSEAFTVKELNDMTFFYRSTTGQKLLLKLPAIEVKSLQFSLERLRKCEKELSAILDDLDD